MKVELTRQVVKVVKNSKVTITLSEHEAHQLLNELEVPCLGLRKDVKFTKLLLRFLDDEIGHGYRR